MTVKNDIKYNLFVCYFKRRKKRRKKCPICNIKIILKWTPILCPSSWLQMVHLKYKIWTLILCMSMTVYAHPRLWQPSFQPAKHVFSRCLRMGQDIGESEFKPFSRAIILSEHYFCPSHSVLCVWIYVNGKGQWK